ncbi:TauD/TfdA family dioxygenase [Longispora urticae]
MTDHDPYDDLEGFSREAAHAWAALDDHTRHLVTSLADGSSERPELYVSNLPEVRNLPPTPSVTRSWARIPHDQVSEAAMLTFAVGLGHPMSYLDQRDGSVFHDIYPTSGNAAEVSSQSSIVSLGHHTEMFFHPEPPDFLMLHCLRSLPERRAYTSVSSLGDMEAILDDEDRQVLREPLFALDLARLHGMYVNEGRPIAEDDPRPRVPAISSPAATQRFRFEPGLVTPTTAAAARAMHHAEDAADRVAVRGTIRERGLFIVDNRRAAHSRSPFSARFDGRDRWLKRMMIGTAPAFRSGVIRHHDLDLLRTWRANGAIIEHVAYPARG